MNKRTMIYLRQYSVPTGTEQELLDNFARASRDRGDTLIGTYIDDGRIAGRGKYANWRRLLGDLGGLDQMVLADPGDLPGRTVGDLLSILATLTEHGVAVVVPSQGIDTSTGPAAILDLIRVYRRAKLSQSIKAGLDRAKAAGRHVGRPPIPEKVRRRIVADLGGGGSVRGGGPSLWCGASERGEHQAGDGGTGRRGGVAMPLAVVLRLDAESAGTIDAMAHMLPERLGDDPGHRYPPHIKLAVFGDAVDATDVDAALATTIGRPALPVTLAGIGVFPSDPATVWLAAVPTAELLSLHATLRRALADIPAHPNFDIGAWLPHITIARTHLAADTIEFLTIVWTEPIVGWLDALDLVQIDPVRVLSRRPLRT